MTLQQILDRLRASALGRAEYKAKCTLRKLSAPLEQKSDERYIASIPKLAAALEQKQEIRVLFFAQHPAYWRCDQLYRLMLNHRRFAPYIVVCGGLELGHEQMLADAHLMEQYLKERGYNYLMAYNENDAHHWLDIRKEINPDIIFYAKPYEGTLPKQYHINAFRDKLFCYLPYGYQTTNDESICNTRYCRISWLRFTESPLVMENSPVLRRNIRITGSCKADDFEQHRRSKICDPWKIKDRTLRRIIWAPHHSVAGGTLGYSNFLNQYNVFLELAQQYADRLQIAFKPHPLLRTSLYNLPEWGKKRTDEYYDRWRTLPNGLLAEGDYVDLFLTSDAMIHDCSSFTEEYLLTGNPVMFLAKEGVEDTLNGFGRTAFALHYKGLTAQEIEHFITHVVLGGDDPLRAGREAFYHDHLLSPHGKSASENMIDEILKFK